MSDNEDLASMLNEADVAAKRERQERREAKMQKLIVTPADCTPSDLGNANRLIKRYGDRIRYCPQTGKWLVWDDARWATDDRLMVERYAIETAKAMLKEAAEILDSRERQEAAEWALNSHNAARIAAMIKLAQALVAVTVAELDVDPWLFNVQNGTLNLQTGELLPHDPALLITKLAPVAYDSQAQAPVWDKFLTDVFAGNTALIEFVKRYGGYSLIGKVFEHILAILHGDGSNGKSVLLNTLLAVFGDYGCPADPDLLLSKTGEAHPTGVADLVGVRLAVTNEVEDGRRLAENLVKQLTGGDERKARFMRQDFFRYTPSDTFWIAANHKPQVRGQDFGIWRRIKMVPFTVKFVDDPAAVEPPHKLLKDKTITEKLKEELPGILNWLIAGCLAWQRDGLQEPPDVKKATEAYRTESDPLTDFLADDCTLHPNATVPNSVLYHTYTEWAAENGTRALTHRRFSQLLKLTHPQLETARDDTRKWVGIGLKAGNQRPPADTSDTSDTESRLNGDVYAYSGQPGNSVGSVGSVGIVPENWERGSV